METLTLTETGNTTTMHVQVHLDGHSPTLDQQQRQHFNQQQTHQLVNLGDIGDLTHDLHDDIVSIPKEVMLISLVAQEQALYNPKHEYYRNTHRKDAKWLEIAETVGWTEVQCKSKWKAMRDQYCRELKRSKFNTKAHVKWKYFKELEFLRPFALSRNYRPRTIAATTTTATTTTTLAKNNNLTISVANNNNHHNNNCQKLPSIKLENGQFTTSCDFTTDDNVLGTVDDKNDPRLILTDEQLNSVMQQHSASWNYLTTTSTTTATTDVRNMQANQHNANNLDDTNLLQQQHHTGADDMLCALVESVNAVAEQMQQTQAHHNDEEDDDPIHTFLNMESFFEKDLIGMVQQEDILYNNFHPNYRNPKFKLEVWDEIARKLKKPVGRCRLKWKALRDQYIREHKRLKDRENSQSLPRWKHYDALCFLQKFIKHKASDFDTKNAVQLPKNDIGSDIDDHLIDSSPLQSPVDIDHDLEQQSLPTLSGPHSQQQQQQQQQQPQQQPQQQHQQQHQLHSNTHDICIVSGSSVSGYDEMDIDHYIIGHASDNGANDDGDDMDADDVIDDVDDDEDRKSQQHFPDYTTPSTSNSTMNNNNSNQVDNNNDIEVEEHKFADIKDHSTMTTQNLVAALQQQQQQLQQRQQLQQQHQQQQQLHQQQQSFAKLTTQSTQCLQSQTHQSQQQHQQQQQQQQQHLLTLNVVGEAHTATLNTSDEAMQSMQNQQQKQHHQHQQQQQQHDFSNDIKPQQQNQQTHTNNRMLNSVNTNLTAANVANVLSANCGLTVMNSSGSLNMNNLNLHALTTNSSMANNSTCTAAANTTTTMSATSSSVAAVASSSGSTVAAAQTSAAQSTASSTSQAPTTDNNAGDDEVGAFFKAVAMKIRNAKMSPVAFTDLQIDILRVINETLRNH